MQGNKTCMPRSSPRVADAIAPRSQRYLKNSSQKASPPRSVLWTPASVQCSSLTVVLHFIPTFGCRTPDTPSWEERRERGERGASGFRRPKDFSPVQWIQMSSSVEIFRPVGGARWTPDGKSLRGEKSPATGRLDRNEQAADGSPVIVDGDQGQPQAV